MIGSSFAVSKQSLIELVCEDERVYKPLQLVYVLIIQRKCWYKYYEDSSSKLDRLEDTEAVVMGTS
jgi:hypothetical protein